MVKQYDPNSIANRTYRFGKYIIPAASVVPDWRAERAPVRQLAFEELEKDFPDQVKTSLVGWDPGHLPARFSVVDRGQTSVSQLAALEPSPILIRTIQRGSSVGRTCCLVGPEGSAVRETGFFLDRGFSGPFHIEKVSPNYWRHRHRGDLTARFHLPERSIVDGRVAVLNNRVSHNFYHWMVEVAPKIASLQMAGIEVDYYLVDHHASYQKKIFRLLGIPEHKLIQPHCKLHLTGDELLWISNPGESTLRRFVEMLYPKSQNMATTPAERCIYISRRKAVHRRLTNEPELERQLERMGYESLCFEDIPIEQQAALFREAKTIVTVHGAALANQMFGSPSLNIVEMYPERRSNIHLYPNWSRVFGFNHQVVMTQCSTFRQRLRVNIDDVMLAIERTDSGERGYRRAS